MAIRVSLSHPLHYIDQNGAHRKLYGSQDLFYFQGSSDTVLAGMLRIGDLYFPNAAPLYFAYYGGDPSNDQGTRFTDHDISYPVPQTIRGTSSQWGAVPAKVFSIGLRLFFDFYFSSNGSYIEWNNCRVQGINSRDDVGALSGDISVDKDMTITFEFYSFNPDDVPGQTPQGSYSVTIPAGTSDIRSLHYQFLHFSWYYMKRTITIDGVGTFTYPISYAPWTNNDTVQTYKIHLGG